jgi:hypothetical protein
MEFMTLHLCFTDHQAAQLTDILTIFNRRQVSLGEREVTREEYIRGMLPFWMQDEHVQETAAAQRIAAQRERAAEERRHVPHSS